MFLTTQSQIDLPPQLIDGNRVTSISVVENDSTLFFWDFFHLYQKKSQSGVALIKIYEHVITIKASNAIIIST